MKSINFISGLPRSGSTLLAGILRQNPEIHAGMTSPLHHIVSAAMRSMSGENEAALFLNEQSRHDILRGIFISYYGSWNRANIFDTSRAWTIKMDLLNDLFLDARIICCVRNPAWIIDSFERAVRANKLSPSKMFGNNPSMNVYQRTNQLTGPDGIIGAAYNNLREAFFGPHSDKVMLIDYETLCRSPEFVMQSIYQFTNIERPSGNGWHDFNKVEYSANEFDERLGLPGLHTVTGPVRPFKERVTVLPPDIFEAHKDNSFWLMEGARAKSNAIVL